MTTWRYDVVRNEWTELCPAPGYRFDPTNMIENGDFYSDVTPRHIKCYYRFGNRDDQYEEVSLIDGTSYDDPGSEIEERCSYHVPTDKWVHGPPGLRISAKPSPSPYDWIYVDLP